jgi:hypothetical protein
MRTPNSKTMTMWQTYQGSLKRYNYMLWEVPISLLTFCRIFTSLGVKAVESKENGTLTLIF